MSVSTTNSRWEYTGNAVTTAFPYDNLVTAAGDLLVYIDGSLKTLTTDYSVSGVGIATGGSVTFASAPANGASVVIVSAIAATQPTTFEAVTDLKSGVLNLALDRIVRLIQQILTKNARVVVLPDSETGAPSMILPDKASRLGKLFGFDPSTGAPIATSAGSLALGDGDVTTTKIADGAVTTPKIADGAITLAKLANIATAKILGRKTAGSGAPEELTLSDVLDLIGSAARGDILYRGNSGWTRLAAGTSGYFLKTLGAGADPAWAAASAGSGAWELISTLTPSGVASVAFTAFDSSKYDDYLFVLDRIVPVSAGATFNARTSGNGGSSYDSGATDYDYTDFGQRTTTSFLTGGTAAAISLDNGGNGIGNSTGQDWTGKLELINPGASAYGKLSYCGDYTRSSGAERFKTEGTAQRRTAAAVNGIQWYFGTGNISGGKIRCYGRRK